MGFMQRHCPLWPQDILEEAQAIHAFLEKELSRAMPAYYVATDGIRTVTRRELDDIRAGHRPLFREVQRRSASIIKVEIVF